MATKHKITVSTFQKKIGSKFMKEFLVGGRGTSSFILINGVLKSRALMIETKKSNSFWSP